MERNENSNWRKLPCFRHSLVCSSDASSLSGSKHSYQLLCGSPQRLCGSLCIYRVMIEMYIYLHKSDSIIHNGCGPAYCS